MKLATSAGSSKKQESSRKISTFALLTTPKPLTVWITRNSQKFFKRWKYQNTEPASWEICMQVKKQQLELDTVQQSNWKKKKEVHQGCILSLCLFKVYAEYIMWNARLDGAQAGIKIARRNINNLRYADDTTLMAESEEELKSLLMKVKKESEKTGLKLNIQKTGIMASSFITSWQTNGKTMETVSDFISRGSKITADGDCSHEIKRLLLLGRKTMTNLDSILKSRDITLPTKVCLVKAMVFPAVMYGCESWMWVLKNWCFWTVALEKTLEHPLDCKGIQPLQPKGDQSWTFIGRTDAEAETPVLWPLGVKNELIGKDPDAGKYWRQEEKMIEDEMVGWHHRLDGHEFE